MSTSRAIKPKRDDTQLSNWEPIPERAPSVEVAEAPLFARVVAMIGLFLFVLGALAMLAPSIWPTRTAAISPAWGFFFASLGAVGLMFHAFAERDFQFRRIYAFVGIALILAGVILRLLALRQGIAIARLNFTWVQLFYFFGIPGLSIGLIFVLAVIRNETDLGFRNLLMMLLGVVGALMIAACVVVGLGVSFNAINAITAGNFLAGEGALLMLLGLLYVGVYIGQQETNSERAYYAGLGLGAAGIASFLAGFIGSILPGSTFFVPGGLILMGMSLIYIAVALGICVEWPVIVLARRELASYFYSPVGYLVFVGVILVGTYMFNSFLSMILFGGNVFEPIIERYIFSIYPVIVQMFIVPALTMRLLSEEKRTGTLEVLLTAPINEWSIVFGKFIACWVFYMMTWLPWWLFLVALRYMGGEEFDYRPVLSFTAALAAISSGLLAMGLFFSSVTSNQIIAAVFAFVGMIAHLAFYAIKFERNIQEGGAVHEALTYINFFDLWQSSLGGIIAPRYLIFHLSVAVFFLFATVKVLESRKWK